MKVSPSVWSIVLGSSWLWLGSTVAVAETTSTVANDTPSSDQSSPQGAAAPISEETLYTAYDDASWAITSPFLSQKLSPEKQVLYDNFLRDCECKDHDEERLYQNLYQPPAMKNYTKEGFKKIRAPEKLYKLLKDFWDANRDKAVDEWEEPTSFHNHWEINTKMVHLEETNYQGGGKNLSAAVWNAARDVLEEWTGQTLVGSSVYGIRIYYNQSILTPHVDRLPLVSSAIINVDQDVDEPWYLEVYGHDGKATNVSMAPGDMVLYESHSVIHGRPFPMNGKFYANVFCHFEILEGSSKPGELPPYVLEGTEWASYHREEFPDGYRVFEDMERLAVDGELYALKAVAQSDFATIKKNECNIVRDAIVYNHKNILEWLYAELEFDVNQLCRRISNRPGTAVDIAQDAINDIDAEDIILNYLVEAGGKTADTLREEGVVDFYTADEDVSWAIQSKELSNKLGDKQAFYDDFIKNCDNEGEHDCAHHDNYRVKQNRRQPMAMVNYTESGYKKIRAPEALYKLIKDFWDANRDNEVIEWEEEASSFHNLWEVPTTMVRLDNSSLIGGGMNLSAAIWNAGREVLEGWTGQKLAGSSVYGIRVYYNNSILTPHVDRLPLISSAIINVDQEVDEPWYLEVYGHDGKATNVSMAPGDMVLYESHSVIHGRPFPMKGKFYANVFMHFEVMGDISEELPDSQLPPYLMEDSDWAEEWIEDFGEWSLFTDVGKLAHHGDVYTLNIIAEKEPDLIWDRPCRVAIPAIKERQEKVLKFLIEEMEVDVNLVCGREDPGTLLDFAYEQEEDDGQNTMAEYLVSLGGLTIDDESFEGELDNEDEDEGEEEGNDEL